jgi:hypothetical protein
MHELNSCSGGCVSRKNTVAAVVDCGLRKLIMLSLRAHGSHQRDNLFFPLQPFNGSTVHVTEG